MKVKIVKISLFPKEQPTGYDIGFEITMKNGRFFYRDVIVPFEDTVDDPIDEEVVEVAWDILEEEILEKVKELENNTPLLGSIWRDTDLDD